MPNYYSGYVYLYGMGKHGSIGQLVSWHSAGKNAHHAVFALNNNFMLVPYLGSNLIQVYGFNPDTGAITAGKSATLPTADSGPRHVALHANGNWLYAINETAGGASSTDGTIDFFKVDQTAGAVTATATYQVPPPTGYSGAKNGGEIELSPSGNLLYVFLGDPPGFGVAGPAARACSPPCASVDSTLKLHDPTIRECARSAGGTRPTRT